MDARIAQQLIDGRHLPTATLAAHHDTAIRGTDEHASRLREHAAHVHQRTVEHRCIAFRIEVADRLVGAELEYHGIVLTFQERRRQVLRIGHRPAVDGGAGDAQHIDHEARLGDLVDEEALQRDLTADHADLDGAEQITVLEIELLRRRIVILAARLEVVAPLFAAVDRHRDLRFACQRSVEHAQAQHLRFSAAGPKVQPKIRIGPIAAAHLGKRWAGIHVGTRDIGHRQRPRRTDAESPHRDPHTAACHVRRDEGIAGLDAAQSEQTLQFIAERTRRDVAVAPDREATYPRPTDAGDARSERLDHRRIQVRWQLA